MLEKSSPILCTRLFKIDEKMFAPFYCPDNGSPNKPVNILLSLEFLKVYTKKKNGGKPTCFKSTSVVK